MLKKKKLKGEENIGVYSTYEERIYLNALYSLCFSKLVERILTICTMKILVNSTRNAKVFPNANGNRTDVSTVLMMLMMQ
jgi:hypothetical protein